MVKLYYELNDIGLGINKMQAYILPVASFESKEQMMSLVRFISEKRQGV